MNKIYIHFVDWKNTSGNHAGMAYLCKKLKINDIKIELIELKLCQIRGGKYINWLRSLIHTFYFIRKCKKGDTVFFMEYMTKNSAFQENIAKVMKCYKPDVVLKGMIHLSNKHLIEQYKSKQVVYKNLQYLDKIYVMGSSLKKFFLSMGIQEHKIIETLHYVDHDFYYPKKFTTNKILNVICLGNLKRNFSLLKEIIIECPEINFTVCQGVLNLKSIFSDCSNVKLIGFIPEIELRQLMQSSDVSLNVMDDTVGSNVITTSMACGLAMVVSDVGSIRDYCDNQYSILCSEKKDYINALKNLNENRERCFQLQKIASAKSKNFSIKNFMTHFYLNN